MSNNLWPSQKTSTRRATKSTYKPETIPTDWTSGLFMMLFVIVMIAGVIGGLYLFVAVPFFEQLQTVSDTISWKVGR